MWKPLSLFFVCPDTIRNISVLNSGQLYKTLRYSWPGIFMLYNNFNQNFICKHKGKQTYNISWFVLHVPWIQELKCLVLVPLIHFSFYMILRLTDHVWNIIVPIYNSFSISGLEMYCTNPTNIRMKSIYLCLQIFHISSVF